MQDLVTVAQLTVSGLSAGCIYALLAVSFGIVLEATRVFNFASAAVYTLVAYLVWFLVADSVPIAVAVAIGFVVSAVLMVVADYAVHQPLKRRGATSEIVMLGSITVTILIVGVVGLIFGDQFYEYPEWVLSETWNVGGVVITSWNLACLAALPLTMIVIGLVLFRTKLGRSIRAYGDNPELARVIGMRLSRPHVASYILASVAITPASVLVGIHAGLSSGMGLTALLLASAAAILGGIGNVWAAAIGGLILGVATSLPSIWLSPAWQTPIAFAILLVVILVRPQGIFAGRILV